MRGDCYVNATALCKAGNKLFGHYQTNEQAKAYIRALEHNIGYPILKLIESKKGRNGGTWVHPQVATHLAQWISSEFAVQVNKWVFDLLSTGKVEIDQSAYITPETKDLYPQRMSIDHRPYENKDVFYIGVFDPVPENVKCELEEGQECFKFGVTHNVKTRNADHKRTLLNFRFVYLYDSGDGNRRSMIETRVKEMVVDRGLKLDYNDSREMFFANHNQYEELVSRIEELQYVEIKAEDQKNTLDDSPQECRKLEFEDRRHERENEAKRMEMENEAKRMEMENEAKRVEMDHELSMAQTKIQEMKLEMEMMELRAKLCLNN